MEPLTRWETGLSIAGLAAAMGISVVVMFGGGSLLIAALVPVLVIAVIQLAFVRKVGQQLPEGEGALTPSGGLKRTYGLYFACSWLVGAAASMSVVDDDPWPDRLPVAAAVMVAFLLLGALANAVVRFINRRGGGPGQQ